MRSQKKIYIYIYHDLVSLDSRIERWERWLSRITEENQDSLVVTESRDSSENEGGRRQREAVSRDINKAKFKGA